MMNQIKPMLPFIAGIVSIIAYMHFNDQYKEITWREFVQDYLSKNNFQRLEVINKKWVRVISASGEIRTPFFAIGSVDAFERNLQKAQADIGPEMENSTTVVYKEEMEFSTLLNAGLYILPLVFIFYFMRKGMSGLGGMTGGGKGGKGGIFGFGQSTARIVKENTGVKFK